MSKENIYTVTFINNKKIAIKCNTLEEFKDCAEIIEPGVGKIRNLDTAFIGHLDCLLNESDQVKWAETRWCNFHEYTIIPAKIFLEHNQKQQNTMSTKTYTVSREFIGQIYLRVCPTYQREINNYFNLEKNLFFQEFEVLDSKLQEWYNTLIGEMADTIGDFKKLTEAKELLEKQFEFLGKTTQKERWLPEPGRDYFCINSYGVTGSDTHDLTVIDTKKFNFYNCFQTHEEAEKEAKRTTISRKYREWARRMNGDWKPDWSVHLDKWGIRMENGALNTTICNYYNSFIEGVCFPTKKLVEQALEEFGNDLLLLVEYN